MNEPKFDAKLYVEFRPEYPQEIFKEALARLSTHSLKLLDVGCGTGLSTLALKQESSRIQSNCEIFAIDVDSEMLDRANVPGVKFSCAGAENTQFDSAEFDFICAGSAYHWFANEKSFVEMNRILKTGGLFMGFEYQFPKAIQSQPLNDFIRSEFNRNWKAPSQVPRGKFRELFSLFSSSPQYKEIALKKIEMKRNLTLEEFCGHLFSQSRYLHFESTLHGSDLAQYRQSLGEQIRKFYDENLTSSLEFDFRFDRILFLKLSE